MLGRYKIYRGKRPPEDPLPEGIRQDTRKHTTHCLRPTAEIVAAFLAVPSDEAWERMAGEYLELLEGRFAEDRKPFDALAAQARQATVLLGCNCPTKANPDVNHCHTVEALRFMQAKYPELEIRWP